MSYAHGEETVAPGTDVRDIPYLAANVTDSVSSRILENSFYKSALVLKQRLTVS